MIDFIKIYSRGVPYKFENNSYLTYDFKITDQGEKTPSFVNEKDGTKTYTKKAYYKGLKFTITDKENVKGVITRSSIISGSLHLYSNNGKHNYNDFSKLDLVKVLKDLKQKFEIDFNCYKINQIEIGVNIEPPLITSSLLKNCFLHKTKPFENKYNSNEGNFIQCEHEQYKVKAYNKRLHYSTKGFKLENEIFRFELHYSNMEKIHKLGVKTLYDLLKFDFTKFKPLLLRAWNDILYFDKSIQCNEVKFLKLKNPLQWQELASRKKKGYFNKVRSNYRELVLNSSFKMKEKIEILISAKVQLLS